MSAPALHRTGIAGDPASPVHRLDPRAKVLGLLGVTLTAVSAPLRAWPAYVACATVLAAVALAARVRPAEVVRRAAPLLPVVLLAAVALPFVRQGGRTWSAGPLHVHEAGLATLATATGKAAIGSWAAVLLTATTSVPAVLAALRDLRVPAVLVAIAGFTHRYSFVLADELARMRVALAARGHRPRTLLQAGGAGRVGTALFLRAHARGERVHLAMLARGHGGGAALPRGLAHERARPRDAAFVALVAGTVTAARVLAEVLA